MNRKYVIIIAIVVMCILILLGGLGFYFSMKSKEKSETKEEHIRKPVELANDQIEICIAHINDFHAQFEEISENDGACKENERCIGGIARIAYKVKELKTKHKHFIFFNSGDSFYGSSWASHWGWNVTPTFLNMLHIDAYTLGYHDFNQGLYGLEKHLKILEGTVLVCNIDVSQHSDLKLLIDFTKHIEIDGLNIGIIGVMPALSQLNIRETENFLFFDETNSINRYSEQLIAQYDVFTIIILSFCGYEYDRFLATTLENRISIIVGGYSEILLYNRTPPYPTVVENIAGGKVLVVQSSYNSKYLGKLLVTYDTLGKIITYTGESIYMDDKIPKDKDILAEMQPWKNKAKKIEDILLGWSKIDLNSKDCRLVKECALGNLLADILLDYCRNKTGSIMAFIDSRSVIGGIAKGNITFGQLFNVLPYGYTWNCGKLEGKYIKTLLEYTMKYGEPPVGVYVAGIKYYVNPTNHVGNKIGDVQIDGDFVQLMDYDTIYNIGLVSSLSNGKGKYMFMAENIQYLLQGEIDIEIFKEYIKNNSPIKEPKFGRVVINE